MKIQTWSVLALLLFVALIIATRMGNQSFEKNNRIAEAPVLPDTSADSVARAPEVPARKPLAVKSTSLVAVEVVSVEITLTETNTSTTPTNWWTKRGGKIVTTSRGLRPSRNARDVPQIGSPDPSDRPTKADVSAEKENGEGK